jgi:hypothetical protein
VHRSRFLFDGSERHLLDEPEIELTVTALNL